MADFTIRDAVVEDWPQVAGPLVELGRGVPAPAPPRRLPWGTPLCGSEPMRGHGVGAALLARAEELALKRGCFRMSLETAGWRDATHTFYSRQGWTDNGKWFVKLLDESWATAGYDE